MTPLAQQIAECIDTAIFSYDGRDIWRDAILNEQWKIIVEYTATPTDKICVRVVRRDLPLGDA